MALLTGQMFYAPEQQQLLTTGGVKPQPISTGTNLPTLGGVKPTAGDTGGIMSPQDPRYQAMTNNTAVPTVTDYPTKPATISTTNTASGYTQPTAPEIPRMTVDQQRMMMQQPATVSGNYGLAGQEQALAGGAQSAINQMNMGNMQGIGALQGTRQDIMSSYGMGNQAINDALMAGRGDIAGGLVGAQNYLNQGQGQLLGGQFNALNNLGYGMQQARDAYGGYQAGGREAAQQQAALSGSMGAEAQRNAIASVLQSPEFDFIRDQGRREIMANAAATGGTGGGEVLRDLTRFGQGLAAQRFDTAYNRLGDVANRGLGVAGQISNLFGSEGAQRAGLIGDIARARAGLSQVGAGMQQQAGQSLAGLSQTAGQNIANLASQQAGTQAGLGSQAASMFQQGGRDIGSLIANTASQIGSARQTAGRDLADQVQRQALAQQGLLQQQGSLLGGSIDNFASNISNMLSAAGAGDEAAQQQLARLMQAIAAGQAAGGAGVYQNLGEVQANAALQQGRDQADLLSGLSELGAQWARRD